ncbi:unnamed protein product [Hydatigera taeniaeformis]|uniref:U4/U6.U5 tri-snRNP-associated protein 1 n=1 Tax=Hydatigena taeniaeformis TaxID=6205 RepID=A0A0R3WVM4_HYDTA|nr:unnamed protein product [Hydatigera taeniaeformis]
MHEKEKREDESKKRKRRSRSRSKDRHTYKEPKKPKVKRRKVDDEGMFISKLRAKLGLAPLDLGSDSKAGSDEFKSRNSDADFVHAPAKDITKERQTEKLQEKIATAKEKRELLNKLREVKSLGSGEETNVSSWVEKMRSKEKAKIEAEKREKMLIEMDEAFGVSAVVAERIRPKRLKVVSPLTSLEGLKVEHSVDRFSEANPIILTLKDKGTHFIHWIWIFLSLVIAITYFKCTSDYELNFGPSSS